MCFRILNLVGKKQYKTNKQQTNKTPQNFYPNKSLSNSYNSKMEIRLSSGGIRHLGWEQCPTHNVASGGGAAPLTSCIPLCDGSFLPGCKSAAESHSKNNRRQDQTPQVARAPHYHSTSTVPFSKAAPESQLCCSCFLASHSLLSPFQAGFRPYRRAGNSFVKTSVSDHWSIFNPYIHSMSFGNQLLQARSGPKPVYKRGLHCRRLFLRESKPSLKTGC